MFRWGNRVFAACLALASAAPMEAHATSIEGAVRYHADDSPVPHVVVDLVGPVSAAATTLADGSYAATHLPAGSWLIAPRRATAVAPELEVSDGLRMLAVAAGTVSLDAAERLACDVTGNGKVTALDAALTMRYALGMIPSLPAWETCQSPQIFIPDVAPETGLNVSMPFISPSVCQSGWLSIAETLVPAAGLDFAAVIIGDCDGSWQPPAPQPTATVTQTSTPPASATPSRSTTPSPTATRTYTPSQTPTRSATPSPTRTPSATPSTPPTSTPSQSATPTSTPTATATSPPAPSGTATVPPDAAACAASAVWNLGAPQTLHTHENGEVWLTEAVPTDTGWGLFWLRRESASLNVVRLYYAHVGFSGEMQVAPVHLRDINFLQWRRRYYLSAWHADHFGLLIADGSTLSYFNLSKAGTLTGQRTVGPQLFNSSLYGHQADGDMISYPGGFGVIIEGNCSGHLCSYAFRLGADGTPTSSVYNLVDFDGTHQFDPRIAFDGTGFALLSVKDGGISTAGVVTKYMTATGSPGSRARVVPNKEYFWDEWTDVAWNGDHFAAIWTENTGRDHNTPWRMRFASFRRDASSSTTLGENIIEVLPSISRIRHWTTQLHSLGATWLGQYTRFVDGPNFAAVYRWLNDDGEVLGTFEPFVANTDALGSNVHPSPAAGGKIAIVRGFQDGSAIKILFQLLDRPTCDGS